MLLAAIEQSWCPRSRRRTRRLVTSVLLCFILNVLLCRVDRSSGVRSSLPGVRAATAAAAAADADDGRNDWRVYASVQELNEVALGASHTFSEIIDGGGLAVSLPTDDEVGAAVQHARDAGTRSAALAAAAVGGTVSMCAVDYTCPRSSAAWASGSFTTSELLTPHSLSLPVGLRLQLSLCCQYRFDGTLLRSAALYDIFLRELLQATPFQALSAAQKRELFPQSLVYTVDTWGRRRAYNTSYVPTDADAADGNDGDGDVLVLTTGTVSTATLRHLFASSPVFAGGGGSDGEGDDGDSGGGGGSGGVSTHAAAAHLASTGMQLRITNHVLKCKCPHTLSVMPLLHMRRDTLPPISIVGLGAHCGVMSNSTRSAGAPQPIYTTRRLRRVRGAQDGAVAIAASFAVTPPVPSTSLVTWVVRKVATAAVNAGDSDAEHVAGHASAQATSVSGSRGTLVLRHSRIVPVPRCCDVQDDSCSDGPGGSTAACERASRSSAPSPFFIVEPNVRYEVSVSVLRWPLGIDGRRYEAEEVLRQHQSAQQTDGSAAHATTRSVAVSMPPTQRTAVGRFILRVPLPRTWAPPPATATVHFGFRRQMRLTSATLARPAVLAALHPRHPPTAAAAASDAPAPLRPLDYYGVWQNQPLRDQPLPQRPVRVMANPFADASTPVASAGAADEDGDGAAGSVAVPLFLGRNRLAYLVRDVDDVCEPVVLETREVWAVQSHVATAGPITACGEEQDVSALVLRQLLQQMRVEPRLEVTVPNTTWLADPRRVAEAASEGRYRCAATAGGGGAPSPQCSAVADTERDPSGVHATLRMSGRGVYEVVWVARVAVRGELLLRPANLDPLYATVLPSAAAPPTETAPPTFVVEVRSRPLLVVRRLASYPRRVVVDLPMHARRWLVAPPRAAAAAAVDPATALPAGATVDVLRGGAPAGYWHARPPLRVVAVDERQTAEVDTQAVPNVQRTLPNGTLEFVVQDTGESLSLSVTVDGVVRVVPYTSRCPDTHVEHVMRVVALPPPPIAPPLALIYTEEACVLLVAPREVLKDEVAEWQIPPCPSAQQPPYLVERLLTPEELSESALVSTAADGGAPVPASLTARPVLLACGVEAHHHCDVVWSARNLVAEVHKTYSLRRCQRPPDVVFHASGRQMRVSYPKDSVFVLPSVVQVVYAHGNRTSSLAEAVAASATAAGGDDGAVPVTVHRRRQHRRVIPVAGYAASIGYSFNFTGEQDYMEMRLHPLEDPVAHQLRVTQHAYVAGEEGPLVLRWQTRAEVQLSQPGASLAAVLRAEEDEDAHSTGATPPPHDAAAQQRPREPHDLERDELLDGRLKETYTLVHEATARQLRVSEVGDASLFSMDYVVRGSPAVLSQAAAAERPEFTRRGMCVERPGHIAVLAVSPRGAVEVDERYGTVLPPPPEPAIAVLPFCAPHYIFARHPELSSVYGYDFTWTCPDASGMTVEKRGATHSVISHTPERWHGGGAAAAAGSANASEAMCELAVRNDITGTERRDAFLVRRVHPSPLPATAFAVLSRNAADSLQVVLPSPRGSRARPPHHQQQQQRQRQKESAASSAADVSIVSMEMLHSAPANHYPFAKAYRVVGKSAVLHVDAPSTPAAARWAVTSVVPATPTTVGAQVLMDGVAFNPLPHHPAAIARGRGGTTALVDGLDTPGLYTITHGLPDPGHPAVCPPVLLTAVLDVFHARVVEKELFVCGDTAMLRATPVPREIAHEFVAQWEVVSLTTDAQTTWTAGVNFSGIVFQHGRRAETLVRGLPFGIVTMRWAIYRLTSSPSSSPSSSSSSSFAGAGAQHRVLVDYDTVEVFVLTENLASHRLVTLADRAMIRTTSSTRGWRIELDAATAAAAAAATTAAAAARGGIDAVRQVRMSWHDFDNSSHAVASSVPSHDADESTALLHTYYGRQPRPGARALVLEHLPTGTVHLRYDLVASRNVFGRMEGHTCTLQGHYEVERVSAYLTASTTMDHECDGYTGDGRITLCLHTEAAPAQPAARADAQLWQSRVRLADPATLEDAIKQGAREVERLSGERCATPWWVSPTARWSSPYYTTTAASVAPGRCVTFTVQAGRHLAPREVSQPMFAAVLRPASSAAADAGVREARGGLGSSAVAAAAASCPFGGDFIPARVIDGAPGAEVTDAAAATDADTWGVRFLPVLQLSDMRRSTAAMRPMVGLRGVPDDVTAEVNISGSGADAVPEATVMLRLDLSQPGSLGGFAPFTATASEFSSAAAEPGHPPYHAQQQQQQHLQQHQGLLYKCVEGTVRGADVLQYWTETNRPDSHVGRTAQEWLDYVHAVRDAVVPCDVLFNSLEPLLTEAHGDTPHASALASWTGGWYSSPARGEQQQQRVLPRHGLVSLREQHQQQQRQPFISLAEMEAQVEQVRRRYRWTADGIDVTGLSAELQEALGHRRVTATQLRTIEALRKSRQAAEAAEAAAAAEEEARRLQQRHLESAPPPLSPTERLAKVIEAYQGVAHGGEVAVLRIRLPLHRAFAVPYDLFLRTALHKDVVCGTAVDPPPAVTDSSSPPLPPPPLLNPHSLVTLGRVEVRDTAPTLSAHPATVKQCEVEGGLPVLTFELAGANFARNTFTADEVTLEEIPHPHMVVATDHGAAHTRHNAEEEDDVGLTACLAEMRRGLRAAVEADSRKRLYLQLRACPSFKMLSAGEYNEHQSSDALLRRLRLPRYLRVTVRDAIVPDSFLSRVPHTANASGPVEWTPGRVLPASVAATSPDASFVIEVRPTLARLHLRSTANSADHANPSVWWGGAASSDTAVTPPPPPPPSPLLLCESDLRRRGFQLGIELIGDVWTPLVGEDGDDRATARRTSAEAAVPHRGPSPRAAPNVAMLNSFSVVEHHRLDSSQHLYLSGGGVYRSHFIHHLFTELLGDTDVQHRHRFVRRVNDTVVVVSVPPLSTAAARSHSGGGGGVQRTSALPAVRRFCKVEEILFAVPGIATECRGCLLADTTFYMAGDLTGRWTASSPASSRNGGAGGRVVAPEVVGAHRSGGLVRPLVLAWDSVARVPRRWQFDWVCPATAHAALEDLSLQLSGRSDGAALTVVADVVLYRLHGADGAPLPAAQRPMRLLSSTPVELEEVLRQNRAFSRRAGGSAAAVLAAPLVLNVDQAAADAGYTQLADDVLRRRRHAQTTLEYHRDDRYADGRLAVNASVFLKVCVRETGRVDSGAASCTVVSITDALLAVEAPRQPAPPPTSWARRLLGRAATPASAVDIADPATASASPVSLSVMLHHALMTALTHELLPALGVVVVAAPAGAALDTSASLLEEQRRAHIAFTVMAFVAFFAAYAYTPTMAWVGLCVVVWMLSLYHGGRPGLVLLFAAWVLHTHQLL
ncbi:hypothetical protein NESM_000431700 [Novymonas esmeraldas]|uniref:Uncharacterized protein n=1 Tax=Novymonas esmeraldas TaxID=1808958 RepID=A0AAW0EPH2_9TRYP